MGFSSSDSSMRSEPQFLTVPFHHLVSLGVYAKMKELKTRFPEGLDYQIVYDTTPFIRESIYEVFNTLRDAIILVAIVVLAFLQNWRAAVIPLTA